jgi:Ino eighty subunit 2
MPHLRSRANLTAPSAAPTASSTRPRRNTANQAPPTAVIQRSKPEEYRQSMNLTVKASPGKLRQATRGAAPAPKAPNTTVSSRNIVAGKRASRSSRVVQEVDSDDEEDEDEDEEADEVDAMDVDDEEEDAEGDEDEEMDAEGDEDDEMDITPAPAPRIVVSSNKNVPVKPSAAQDSVEVKELGLDDDDDEELSELESEEEEEDDAEGEEDDEIPVPNEDEEMDSDEDLDPDQTPDLSKMTRRQQAMVTEGADELISLSNGACYTMQKKTELS